MNPKHLYLGTYEDNNKYTHLIGRRINNGEYNPRSSFYEEDIIKIRELYKTMTVAKIYKRKKSTIDHIV